MKHICISWAELDTPFLFDVIRKDSHCLLLLSNEISCRIISCNFAPLNKEDSINDRYLPLNIPLKTATGERENDTDLPLICKNICFVNVKIYYPCGFG